jgi:hypothetical protein
VFLSGIDSVSDAPVPERQVRFLERLRDAVPDDTAVVQVFPYSVTNRALTGERAFARFWRWALRRKMGQRRLDQIAGMLINVRNMWQVMVSADRRYGPFYDRGTAALMVRALRQPPATPGSDVPVVLIGYSGGGQIAVGATPFVTRGDSTRRSVVLSLAGCWRPTRDCSPPSTRCHRRRARPGPVARCVAGARALALLPYSPWNEAQAPRHAAGW